MWEKIFLKIRQQLKAMTHQKLEYDGMLFVKYDKWGNDGMLLEPNYGWIEF